MADMNAFGSTDWFDGQEEQRDFDAIPAGEYPVIIISSGTKETAKKDGSYLELRLQITDGKYQNRLLFDRLNLVNKNQTAQNIARSALKAICVAVGFSKVPERSEDLHMKKLIAKIDCEPDTRDGKDGKFQNSVKKYLSASGVATSKAATAPADPTGYKF